MTDTALSDVHVEASTSTTFASMCVDADNHLLFAKVTGISKHLLHVLLPPLREQHYSLSLSLCVNVLTIITCQITLQPSRTKTFSLYIQLYSSQRQKV